MVIYGFANEFGYVLLMHVHIHSDRQCGTTLFHINTECLGDHSIFNLLAHVLPKSGYFLMISIPQSGTTGEKFVLALKVS